MIEQRRSVGNLVVVNQKDMKAAIAVTTRITKATRYASKLLPERSAKRLKMRINQRILSLTRNDDGSYNHTTNHNTPIPLNKQLHYAKTGNTSYNVWMDGKEFQGLDPNWVEEGHRIVVMQDGEKVDTGRMTRGRHFWKNGVNDFIRQDATEIIQQVIAETQIGKIGGGSVIKAVPGGFKEI